MIVLWLKRNSLGSCLIYSLGTRSLVWHLQKKWRLFLHKIFTPSQKKIMLNLLSERWHRTKDYESISLSLSLYLTLSLSVEQISSERGRLDQKKVNKWKTWFLNNIQTNRVCCDMQIPVNVLNHFGENKKKKRLTYMPHMRGRELCEIQAISGIANVTYVYKC